MITSVVVDSRPAEQAGDPGLEVLACRLNALADPVRLRIITVLADGEGFAALWAQAATASVPLPGHLITTRRRGPACAEEEAPQ